MDKVSDTKKQPSGENTGRWTNEEHGAFLEGLKAHGKEWKKIANLIETRTVVQIRTHAQKYFQKLAKSREQKGEETPMDLVSTASNPRNLPDKNKRGPNGTRRRANSQTRVKLAVPGIMGAGSGSGGHHKSSTLDSTSLRSDTPLPMSVLGEVEAYASSRQFLSGGSSIASADSDDTLSLNSGGEAAKQQLQAKAALATGAVGAAALAGSASASASCEQQQSKKRVGPASRTGTGTGAGAGTAADSALASSSLAAAGTASPSKAAMLTKKQPFSSPQHKLAVPSPPKIKVSSLALKEQLPGGAAGARKFSPLVSPTSRLNQIAEAADEDVLPEKVSGAKRKLTISTALINSSADATIKSRDEEDLKWLMSMTTRLPDGSPTAVSDFMWGQDGFEGDTEEVAADCEMLFPITPSNAAAGMQDKPAKSKSSPTNQQKLQQLQPNKAAAAAAAITTPKAASAAAAAAASGGRQHVVDPSPDLASELDQAEARSIEEWISSSENATDTSQDGSVDSDLLSVEAASDCGELEHQPELAEMGPFTKYVFGDEESTNPAETLPAADAFQQQQPAKRQRVAA